MLHCPRFKSAYPFFCFFKSFYLQQIPGKHIQLGTGKGSWTSRCVTSYLAKYMNMQRCSLAFGQTFLMPFKNPDHRQKRLYVVQQYDSSRLPRQKHVHIYINTILIHDAHHNRSECRLFWQDKCHQHIQFPSALQSSAAWPRYPKISLFFFGNYALHLSYPSVYPC